MPAVLQPNAAIVANLRRKTVGDDFNEGDHPRAPDGKFGAGGGTAYHGAEEKFSEFDPAKIGKTDPGFLGRGFYFSTDPSIARTSKHKMEVNLKTEKPLQIELPDFKTDKKAVVRKALGLGKDATAEQVTAELRKQGYDAVVLDYSPVGYKHQEIMIPDKAQIGGVKNLPHKPGMDAAPSRQFVGDEDIASAKGHAAGTLYVAPDGSVLLLHRSPDEKNFAGHWSLPGGGVEDGETPEAGAEREAMEEMGPDVPRGRRKLIDQKVTPTGMVFHTFAQPVDEKFTPQLNGEHVGFTWSPMNALPGPMHPAVQDTLTNRVGVAADMSPEDWQGMVGGLLKFLSEEAQEPEHAEDKSGEFEHEIALQTRGDFNWKGLLHHMHSLGSMGASREIIAMDSDDKPVKFNWDGDGADKIVNATIDGEDILTRKALARAEDAALALDRESVRTKDVDGRLHVADVPLCRESVDPYKGSEIPGCKRLGLDPEKIYHLWRPAEELEKALPSINGIPVLRKHVATSAADHKSKETIGAVGTNARWEEPFIVGEIVIWPQQDIELIENKEKASLSPGYRYEPILEDGDFQGQHYDAKMTKIIFNHLSVVEHGRQSEVGIDSAAELQWAAIERAILGLP